MPGDSYKYKVRTRVNGLLLEDDAILLILIQSPVTNQKVWMPPGGGIKFGETMHQALRREFKEETGLEIVVNKFQFFDEVVDPPFHAVELYFSVTATGGTLQLGHDPELSEEHQLLLDIRWIPIPELDNYLVAPPPLKNWIQKASQNS